MDSTTTNLTPAQLDLAIRISRRMAANAAGTEKLEWQIVGALLALTTPEIPPCKSNNLGHNGVGKNTLAGE